jgi:hypothetical protein
MFTMASPRRQTGFRQLRTRSVAERGAAVIVLRDRDSSVGLGFRLGAMRAQSNTRLAQKFQPARSFYDGLAADELGLATLRAAPGQSRIERDRAPFTTLHPALGVVRIDEREFVLADIPGLIEGAHEARARGLWPRAQG